MIAPGIGTKNHACIGGRYRSLQAIYISRGESPYARTRSKLKQKALITYDTYPYLQSAGLQYL